MEMKLIKICPNCQGKLERGVLKYGGHLSWESTESDAYYKEKHILPGRLYGYYHRGAISAEKCNNCNLTVIYVQQ